MYNNYVWICQLKLYHPLQYTLQTLAWTKVSDGHVQEVTQREKWALVDSSTTVNQDHL